MSKGGRLPPGRPGPAGGAAVRPLLDKAGGLLTAGKGSDALPLLLQASAMARTNVEAAHMLGVAYLQCGRGPEGIEALKRAVMLAPNAAPILNHLGVALCQAGKGIEGIGYLRKAMALAPDLADARNNLAHALSEAGDFASAAGEYRALVTTAPQMRVAWQGLASALHKLGDIEAALAAADEALARFPGDSGFLTSRGRILMDLRRRDEAEKVLRQALASNPANGEAANNLGTLIDDQGRQKEALLLYERAVSSRPDLGDAWFNLGNAHEKLGDLAKARSALERATTLRPRSAKTLAALIGVRRKLCDWQDLDKQVDALVALIRDPDMALTEAPSPFSLLSLMVGGGDQRRAAELHSLALETRAAAWLSEIGAFERRSASFAGRKIRIGYLSPDFREHPIAQLMAGVIEAHDRDRFEIFAWSLGPDDASRFRRRIETGSDRFEDIRQLDIGASVKAMRDADLDIVVDLAGYTAHARPEILALRAAPLQVNYLGFPGTMGAGFIDYIIVDPTIAREVDEHFYSERVVRLPDCYQANDDKAPIDPEPVARPDFGLPDDAFVFCSFSMNYKIDAQVLDAWSEILNRVPDAVLWLFRTDVPAAENLHREFSARGIAPARIIFADRLPKAKHLARHRLADLFLDTSAYGAHTTASDALWAGLPVLTLLGDTFARRVGASIVRAAGMPDLVTECVEDYIATAVGIASTSGRAAALKASLAANLPSCPLFSTPAIARALEAAYLGMVADLQNEMP